MEIWFPSAYRCDKAWSPCAPKDCTDDEFIAHLRSNRELAEKLANKKPTVPKPSHAQPPDAHHELPKNYGTRLTKPIGEPRAQPKLGRLIANSAGAFKYTPRKNPSPNTRTRSSSKNAAA
jgi:hypothetical protein